MAEEQGINTVQLAFALTAFNPLSEAFGVLEALLLGQLPKGATLLRWALVGKTATQWHADVTYGAYGFIGST
jgi:hypothetical protein